MATWEEQSGKNQTPSLTFTNKKKTLKSNYLSLCKSNHLLTNFFWCQVVFIRTNNVESEEHNANIVREHVLSQTDLTYRKQILKLLEHLLIND